MKPHETPDTRSLLGGEVGRLAALLERVLEEAGGKELVADVERLRNATAALREQPSDSNRKEVVEVVVSLDLERAAQVARAFTIYFQLVNLAEEHHRVRDLAGRARKEGVVAESLAEAVATIRDWEGEAGLRDLLGRLEITPVLTAHPTEARRRAVVEALERIARELSRLDGGPSPAEESDVERRLLEEIATLWRTDQLRGQRPTALDEVRGIMALFDETIFDVAPAVYRELDRSLDPLQVGARPPAFHPFLRWGSWVGGDRDGNPAVTPEVTQQAIAVQAEHILLGLETRARGVARAMSASAGDVPPAPGLMAALASDGHVFPEEAEALEKRIPDAPHRRMLILVAERISATRLNTPGRYLSVDELVEELRLVQRSLAEGGAPRLAYGELQHLVWQAETFGFHLASLEVREHSSVVERAARELLPTLARDPAGLHVAATSAADLAPVAISPEAESVLGTLRAMKRIQERYGADACRRYIVSFTRRASDVVAVRALARIAVPDGSLSIDVVPLFESKQDLEAATETLDDLFELPGADRWLESRGNRLEVMLGYSDSAKDVGVLAANLILYQAQAELAGWARKRGIILTLFHGRGGALGRGGGPTNRAISAQAPGSVDCRFKVTEQGEVTFARYSNPRIAQRHLEQVTNAVLLASTPTAEKRAASVRRHEATAARMAEASRRAYRSLVEQSGFGDFFVRSTPMEQIAELNIASRPARRNAGADFDDLRAIPWVFAWTQSRCNLPGWYGLGSGLDAVASEPGGLDELRAMYKDWPFFTTLMENAELSLVKADMPIAQLYLALGRRPDLAAMIEDEFRSTERLVLAVTEHDHLLAEEPRLRRDIALRNPYIDALSFLQVRFLEELRDGVTDASRAERISRLIHVTINGVAAGLQNTG